MPPTAILGLPVKLTALLQTLIDESYGRGLLHWENKCVDIHVSNALRGHLCLANGTPTATVVERKGVFWVLFTDQCVLNEVHDRWENTLCTMIASNKVGVAQQSIDYIIELCCLEDPIVEWRKFQSVLRRDLLDRGGGVLLGLHTDDLFQSLCGVSKIPWFSGLSPLKKNWGCTSCKSIFNFLESPDVREKRELTTFLVDLNRLHFRMNEMLHKIIDPVNKDEDLMREHLDAFNFSIPKCLYDGVWSSRVSKVSFGRNMNAFSLYAIIRSVMNYPVLLDVITDKSADVKFALIGKSSCTKLLSRFSVPLKDAGDYAWLKFAKGVARKSEDQYITTLNDTRQLLQQNSGLIAYLFRLAAMMIRMPDSYMTKMIIQEMEQECLHYGSLESLTAKMLSLRKTEGNKGSTNARSRGSKRKRD